LHDVDDVDVDDDDDGGYEGIWIWIWIWIWMGCNGLLGGLKELFGDWMEWLVVLY